MNRYYPAVFFGLAIMAALVAVTAAPATACGGCEVPHHLRLHL